MSYINFDFRNVWYFAAFVPYYYCSKIHQRLASNKLFTEIRVLELSRFLAQVLPFPQDNLRINISKTRLH